MVRKPNSHGLRYSLNYQGIVGHVDMVDFYLYRSKEIFTQNQWFFNRLPNQDLAAKLAADDKL